MDFAVVSNFAVALGMGLLVGMQREWSASHTVGVRTFACIALLGALLATLPAPASTWCLAAGLVSLAALLVLVNLSNLRRPDPDVGVTTEVAALVVYCVGAAAGFGLTLPAVVIGGTTALLLQWKQPLHNLIARIGENDFKAIAHLVLIALVILPVLPDKTYGPYDVLNPYRIWLMVVLIVGISLCAYAAQRILGAGQGSVVSGILGGLVSSTATTVSYARQTRTTPELASLAALVIMLASAVVNLRALFEIGVVAPRLLSHAILPFGALTVVMFLLCLPVYFVSRRQRVSPPKSDNPTQLKAAVVFGLLYAVILFAVAAVKHNFGHQALYVVAAISGLTDMDAITLSTAKLFNERSLPASTAWRVILLAMMSNLVFKGTAAMALGSPRLALYVVTLFLLTLSAGGLLFVFWPEWTLDLLKFFGTPAPA